MKIKVNYKSDASLVAEYIQSATHDFLKAKLNNLNVIV